MRHCGLYDGRSTAGLDGADLAGNAVQHFATLDEGEGAELLGRVCSLHLQIEIINRMPPPCILFIELHIACGRKMMTTQRMNIDY